MVAEQEHELPAIKGGNRFKAAIGANSAAAILLHNHPSRDPAPPEPGGPRVQAPPQPDQTGTLLGICVLAHVICGESDCFYSPIPAACKLRC